jgi:hypothetical protein
LVSAIFKSKPCASQSWPKLIRLLSLCFNHEEFCDGLYVHRKTPSLAIFAGSQAAFFTAG